MNNVRAEFKTVNFRKHIISEATATRTLKDTETGSTCLFDRAAGVVYTLPAACPIGTEFEFVTTVTITSNAAKVITGAATELLVGGIVNSDTDTSNATLQWPALVGSSYIAVSMNGSTTGGIIGDRIKFTKVTTTKWSVVGNTMGTGTVATPFSAT